MALRTVSIAFYERGTAFGAIYGIFTKFSHIVLLHNNIPEDPYPNQELVITENPTQVKYKNYLHSISKPCLCQGKNRSIEIHGGCNQSGITESLPPFSLIFSRQRL